MGKLNNYTGLLCVAILALLGYQMFANRNSAATASFLGRKHK